jgi:branched-chain amino acid aminotransferase
MFLNFNGEVREEGAALFRADNRGLRYGDGLFETMLVREGKIRLGQYHLERLSIGMRLLRLGFPAPFSLDILEKQIVDLCESNALAGAAVRARLTVVRAGSGLYNRLDSEAWYCIETAPATSTAWRKDGLVLGVFPDGRRVCDAYSGIKSNNYQLSTLAGMFATEKGFDDCLLLNGAGRAAETAIANIWWVNGDRIYTPPLSEGCVAGVMRRFLLGALPAAGYIVQEQPIGPAEWSAADEVFISNAIQGVQWVRELAGHDLRCRLSARIFDEIICKIQG